jgi:pSer/pThr/pTyr-binding forkhead associated (FHA) protein
MSGLVVLLLRLLLAVSLYAFLILGFFTLWRDIKQQGVLLVSRRVPPISLRIQSGKSSPQVRHFLLPEITVGRDPACECPLDNDTVSARHARLSYHHNQWWIEDLHSSNGTTLNQVTLTLPTVVISGDEFTCGDASIIISLAETK